MHKIDIYKKYKILIYQYNGNYIRGWYGQYNNFFFIRNKFEEILSKLSFYNPQFICAARTDRGVHALHNLCSFIIYKSLNNSELIKIFNRQLPEFIRIVDVQDTHVFFSARYWSYLRTYEYKILINRQNPLLKHFVLSINSVSLDINKMINAQKLLLGMNSVEQFTLKSFTGKLYRTMKNVYIRKEYMHGEEIICFGFTAKSFAHHQIRIIMHYLIQIGLNKMTIEQFELLIQNKIFIQKTLALSQGLYLVNVNYYKYKDDNY